MPKSNRIIFSECLSSWFWEETNYLHRLTGARTIAQHDAICAKARIDYFAVQMNIAKAMFDSWSLLRFKTMLSTDIERMKGLVMEKKRTYPLTDAQIPIPFKDFWEGKIKGHIPKRWPHWRFFMVDGELYIQTKDSALLMHWTFAPCKAVQGWMKHINVKQQQQFPLVRENGEYLFAIHYSGLSDTTAVSESDGEEFIVHST